MKGSVVDATGEPVIGASVVVEGTTNGTITDFDGKICFASPFGQEGCHFICGVCAANDCSETRKRL